jgi:hypothetical protein
MADEWPSINQRAHFNRKLRFCHASKLAADPEPDVDFTHEFSGRFSVQNDL